MPTTPMFSEYGMEAQGIERGRRLAALLQQSSFEPAGNAMSGGWAVPISPFQGLNKMAQGYVGAQGQKVADERLRALAARMRGDTQQTLSAYQQALAGGDSKGAMAALANSPNPAMQQMALAALMKQAEPHVVGKDAALVVNGSPQFTNTAPPEYKPYETMGPNGAPQTSFYDPRHPPTAPVAKPIENVWHNLGGTTEALPKYGNALGQGLSVPNTKPPIAPQWGPLTQGPRGSLQQTDATSGETLTRLAQEPASVQVQVGGQGKIEGDALDIAAARYKMDGTLPTNLGRGAQGAANTVAILTRAAALSRAAGDTSEEARITQLANKASTTALADLSKRQTQVGAFEKTFVKNTQLVESLSSKVDRTGMPLANKWIQVGKRAIAGDADLVAFDAAIKGAVNEYTKIVSGSMGNVAMAEQEIRKIEGLLTAAQTPEQLKNVLQTMRTETQNRMAGFAEEKAQLMQGFKGRRAEDHPTVERGISKSGKPMHKENGQWVYD